MSCDQNTPAPESVSEEFAPPPVEDEAAKRVRATLVVAKHKALERIAAFEASRDRRDLKLMVAEEEALRVSQVEVELISSSAPIVIDDQANSFKMPAVMEVVPRDTLSVKELITLTDAGLLSYWYEEFCSGSSKTTEIMDEAWRCYTAFNKGGLMITRRSPWAWAFGEPP